MAWDKTGAVRYLQANARLSSQSRCAEYTRRAIEAGGLRITHTAYAKDYGSSLVGAGFHEVDVTPQRGDVVVIQAITGHPYGHMAMFDGQIWISDFRQLHGFYPGQAYRTMKPTYKIFRHD
ncbi:CHAP domain-containing protein [Paraburkholderia sp. 32]|uniref:CHAP domain-containing protein n=1 Tax=Paraburkholderia sp. 32 TaxID=2991057 RepID=UPI003D1B62F2